MPGSPFMRLKPRASTATIPINGVVYGDSLGGATGGQTPVAAHLQTLRPQDTWTYVSHSALMLSVATNNAHALGFKQSVHDVYYVPGARNVVIDFSILHGECNDTNDTANQIFDNWRAFVLQQQGFGWEVGFFGVPGTTEYNDPLNSPYRKLERAGVNNLFANGDGGTRLPKAGAQYYVNTELIVGLRTNDPPASGDGDPTYFINDTPVFGAIHLTSYAYGLLAAAMHVQLG